jgi:transcriptional regulator with XRE-family HTH domain
MSTAELEPVVDAELVEAVPLTERQAKALDKKIRTASDKFTDNWNTLLTLLEEAARRQIHVALGKSWTAWFKDAVQITPSDRVERKALVSLMSGKGMSQRAIASVIGVGVGTVNRDLAGVPTGTPEPDAESAKITGLDNKTYKWPEPEPEPEPVDTPSEPTGVTDVLDVEEVEPDSEPEPESEAEPESGPEPEPKLSPVTSEFRDEVYNLQNNVQAFKDILDDERFPKARRRIAKSHADTLGECIADLQTILDLLTGDIVDRLSEAATT